VSARGKLARCADVAPLLVFYSCDEVTKEERAQIEAHLGECSDCRGQLNEESELQSAFSDMPQPADLLDASGTLLSQYRSELSEALDDLSAPPLRQHWQPFGWMRRWMALRPVWSSALLVIVGALAGSQGLQWFAGSGAPANGPTLNVLGAPRITTDQLSRLNVAGISFSPSSDSSSGTVQVRLRAEQPLVLSGNVDDADVRRVLTFVIANGDRFDPGVRLDCLDALKARTSDVEVRKALLSAARNDQNPAVRMKALEALRDSAQDHAVRDVLLDALQHDTNPGVRVEAVNLLVHSLDSDVDGSDEPGAAGGRAPETAIDPSDPAVGRIVRALEELQHRDPNRYVRLRSAAALRQIGPQESH
jgi:hypothetical protein